VKPGNAGGGKGPQFRTDAYVVKADPVRRTCGVTGDRSYRFGPESAVDLQRAYQAAISNHSNGDCR
jgi:hypothetical protein